MHIKTTLQTPRKHFHYHKSSTGINIFVIFVAFKGYLYYKTITSQNVLSKAQIKNFFIL